MVEIGGFTAVYGGLWWFMVKEGDTLIRSQLVKNLRLQSGSSGTITRTQLMAFLGYKDRHSVERYLFGVMRIGAGYSIEDIADRIMEVEHEKAVARS